jgi:glucose/arabinose dehydrogenase
LAGGNYGWRPDYPCDNKAPAEASVTYPLTYFTPPEGITGVMVYDGEMFPEWAGGVFFCGWNRGLMWIMGLNDYRDTADSVEVLRLPNHSCSTDILQAPDGSIVFTNYDGIYRLTRP